MKHCKANSLMNNTIFFLGDVRMYAERMIVETDPDGNLKQLPKLPANCRLEAIFLVMDEQAQNVRQPHPESAGRIRIPGDIFSSTPEAAEALLAECYGAWGQRPVTEVTAIIEAQRRLDWGDD
jgi:hypothetical protein